MEDEAGLCLDVVERRLGYLRVSRLKVWTSREGKTRANRAHPNADATNRPIPSPSSAHVPPRLAGEPRKEMEHARDIRCRYQNQDHMRGRSYVSHGSRASRNHGKHKDLQMDPCKGRWSVEPHTRAPRGGVCVPSFSKEASRAERRLRSPGTLDPHVDSNMSLSCCQKLHPVTCMSRAARTTENGHTV